MADVSFPLPQRVSTINSINGTNKRDPSTWCQRPTNPLVDDFYPLIKARTRLKQYYLLKVTTFECLYHSLLNISLINIRENIGKIFDFFLNLDATKQDELYLRLNQTRLSSWKPSNLLEKKKIPFSPFPLDSWMILEKVETIHLLGIILKAWKLRELYLTIKPSASRKKATESIQRKKENNHRNL